jgi:hypothetical protein
MVISGEQRDTLPKPKQAGWTAGRLDGWTAGRMDGWTAGRLDCWTAGRLDGWTAGWLPDELSGQRLAGRSVALLAASVCERLTAWMID